MEIGPMSPASAGARRRLSPAQIKMAALGVTPVLIEDDVAAAMCGMSAKRFRAECPLPGAKIGRRRVWPREDVMRWARAFWSKHTGYIIAEPQDACASDHERWAALLPSLAPSEEGAHETMH